MKYNHILIFGKINTIVNDDKSQSLIILSMNFKGEPSFEYDPIIWI